MTNAKPLLLEDGSSLDWPDASYSAEMKFGESYATVTHELVGATQLHRLLERGAACWIVELRCPSTLLSRWAESQTSVCTVKWDPTEIQGELYCSAGLVTTEPVTLTAEGLSDLWAAPIAIPAGYWLARSDTTRSKSLAASLITFYPDGNLVGGQIEVRHVTGDGDLHFNVYVSEQLYPQCRTRRDLQIAALIAAFGRIPHLDETNDADETGATYPILESVKDRLRQANVPLWGGELNQDFDPARAATAIEEFTVEPVNPAGSDDS